MKHIFHDVVEVRSVLRTKFKIRFVPKCTSARTSLKFLRIKKIVYFQVRKCFVQPKRGVGAHICTKCRKDQ